MGLKAEQGPATPWGSSEDTALRGERVRRATGLPASRQRVQGTITRASLATAGRVHFMRVTTRGGAAGGLGAGVMRPVFSFRDRALVACPG